MQKEVKNIFLKLIKLMLCFVLFMVQSNFVFAKEIQSTYLVKNITRENLSNFVENYLCEKDYKIIFKNDFYATSKTDENVYYSVILAQVEGNCYLYVQTNDSDKKITNTLVTSIKKNNYKVKSIKTANSEFFFSDKVAQMQKNFQAKNISKKTYDFSDTAQAAFNTQTPKQHTNEPIPYKAQVSKTKVPSAITQTQPQKTATKQLTPLKGSVIAIPQGYGIRACMQSAVSSASLSESDRITAILNEDFSYKGKLIFPAETILYGTAAAAKAASYAYGNGALELNFNQALLPSGQKINFVSEKIVFSNNSSRAPKIVRDIGCGAVVGLLGGLLSAVVTGDYNRLIISTSIGAATGGVHAAVKKGEEIEIPEGSNIEVKISQPFNVSTYH